MFWIRFFGWFSFACILMSFVEHQVHKNMMHKRFFLSNRFKVLEKVFHSHAVLHHGTYASTFSDEPVPAGADKGIRLSVLEGFLESLPIAVAFFFISPMASVSVISVVVLHHLLWNLIHLEMHKPVPRYFHEWAIYKYFARHHMLHHRYPTRNFNVVLPIADYMLRTTVRPRYSDIHEFYRYGLLPRQKTTK